MMLAQPAQLQDARPLLILALALALPILALQPALTGALLVLAGHYALTRVLPRTTEAHLALGALVLSVTALAATLALLATLGLCATSAALVYAITYFSATYFHTRP